MELTKTQLENGLLKGIFLQGNSIKELEKQFITIMGKAGFPCKLNGKLPKNKNGELGSRFKCSRGGENSVDSRNMLRTRVSHKTDCKFYFNVRFLILPDGTVKGLVTKSSPHNHRGPKENNSSLPQAALLSTLFFLKTFRTCSEVFRNVPSTP